MICSFFGHRNTPPYVRIALHRTLYNLISTGKADTFYVGSQGAFDAMVKQELMALQKEFPHVLCYVILTCLPGKKSSLVQTEFPTIFPEGLETVPHRFAIDHRNRWMVHYADIVVTYVISSGGASKFMQLAERMGKMVINLADVK